MDKQILLGSANGNDKSEIIGSDYGCDGSTTPLLVGLCFLLGAVTLEWFLMLVF